MLIKMSLIYLHGKEGILSLSLFFFFFLNQANEMHFINLDALGALSSHILFSKGTICLSLLMPACFEKSFCPSHTQKKHVSNKFPNQILKPVNCRTDYSALPTKKNNCHLKALFPRLGCGVDAWGRKVEQVMEALGAFSLWLTKHSHLK